jgi:predicted polyphosphate/ATP-dependent NAD kinase
MINGHDTHKKLGLIVNPLAGIGGKVGLKGSDGQLTVEKALELGATPESSRRAIEALQGLTPLKDQIQLYTYPAEMGEAEALTCGFTPIVLGEIDRGHTTAADTKKAAREMRMAGIDLILFVGGDGTARDIFEAIGDQYPALGIPAGVKIHSSVYAINPKRAAELIVEFLKGNATMRDMEVMDIDEELFRAGRVSARLYGYLKIPFVRRFVQGAKAGSASPSENLKSMAMAIVQLMEQEQLFYYVLGTGTTVKAVGDELGIDKTLLGVDVVFNKSLVGKDLNERQLLELLAGKPAKIVVTVIGGQGYIFGRGNQQLSPKVIRMVGKQNLIVVASQQKLLSLNGPLLVDTGDPDLDQTLTGYIRVITGYREETVWKIEC